MSQTVSQDAGQARATPGDAQISAARLMAFAAPCLPYSAVSIPLVVYLPGFYANVVGVPLALVGLAFMLARIGDVVVDPLLGGWMDQTRVRFGRFRLWSLICAPILAVGAGILFFPPKGAGFAWLAVGLGLTYLGYSTLILAQMAWGSVLSSAYHGRSRVFGYWQNANVLGLIIAVALPVSAYMAGWRGPGVAVTSMGVFVLATLPVTIGLLTVFTPEPAPLEAASHRTPTDTLAAAFRLIRHPYAGRVILACLMFSLAPGVTGALFQFYFHVVRGLSSLSSNLLLLIYFIGGIVGTPFWTALSRRIGKHGALIGAAAYFSAFQFSIVLFPAPSLVFANVLLFLAGLGYAAPVLLIRAMIADAGDAIRLETGRDETGVLYALINSTTKLGYALAVGAAFPLLALVGFQPHEGAANAKSALDGLAFAFLVPPVLFCGLGAAVMIRYPLTEEKHAAIQVALAAKLSKDTPDHAAHV